MTFDLILNIGHNFLTVRNWAFIFGINVFPDLYNGAIDFNM